jgi:hypothetical protein
MSLFESGCLMHLNKQKKNCDNIVDTLVWDHSKQLAGHNLMQNSHAYSGNVQCCMVSGLCDNYIDSHQLE